MDAKVPDRENKRKGKGIFGRKVLRWKKKTWETQEEGKMKINRIVRN